ncbi:MULTISPECIES: histidine triad nucleotide-binding protein [Demequina]|uniref:histidine triad nucleotide-binding protein n=1 Tax=Demequina TaxID=577469 RepID=UPI00078119B6|nr:MULTISPECIES: histidine triad nucleotide-binding protein [Demequina]
MSTTDCIFCKIVAGEIPATKVVETENVVAFRDIAPKAPVHVLVAPKVHVPDVAAAAREIPDVLAEMAIVAQQVSDAESGGQHRLIFNTGAAAGQTVFHVHAHVLGGATLGWDPA